MLTQSKLARATEWEAAMSTLSFIYMGNTKFSRREPLSANLLATASVVNASTRSLCAWSNTRSSKWSSDMVERKAVNVRSSLENMRSGLAVETGSVARIFSSMWMFGIVRIGQLLSASRALLGASSNGLPRHLCCHKLYSPLTTLSVQVMKAAYFCTTFRNAAMQCCTAVLSCPFTVNRLSLYTVVWLKFDIVL